MDLKYMKLREYMIDPKYYNKVVLIKFDGEYRKVTKIDHATLNSYRVTIEDPYWQERVLSVGPEHQVCVMRS